MSKKILIMAISFFVTNIGISDSIYKIDSIYSKAFFLIKNSNCITNNLKLENKQLNFFVSSQILGLYRINKIDTSSNTFFLDEKFYPKSEVFYIDELLYNLNDICEEIFYDTSKYKFIIFFSEISNNFFIAEVYLYNDFPIIRIDRDISLREDMLFHRSYENLHEFMLSSRFLFHILDEKIDKYWCK